MSLLPTDKGFADWVIGLAAAIDSAGKDSCPQQILDVIARIAPYDMAMIVTYHAGKKPILIYDTFCGTAAKRGLNNYVNQTYLLNPVYNAYLRNLKPGAYRINDVAPDDYFSSEHFKNFKIKHSNNEELEYITNDWPRGMEEIFLASRLPENSFLEISLLRSARHGGFSDMNIANLQSIEPVVAAIFRRHFSSKKKALDKKENAASIENLFNSFSRDILTPRECEVAQLVLKGHSSHSIGDHLGISITTVKTHRKNLYCKLKISSQQELFAFFLSSLRQVTEA